MENYSCIEGFGPRLAGLRKAQGVSQRELAERLCVTRQAVSNWERGTTTPDIDTLCRIGEVLGADWNQLLGPASPAPRPAVPGRRIAAFSLAGALAGAALVCALGNIPADGPGPAEGTALTVEDAPASPPVRAAAGSPLRQSAASLSQVLRSITQVGEIALTPGAEFTGTLRTAFAEVGENCQFRFLPDYEEGVFRDPNMVLTWLYRSAHSRGAAFTTEQVDAWLADWFGPDVQWTHASTEDYPLEDGVYIPHSCWSGTRTYYLERLEHREDGSFVAQLTVAAPRSVPNPTRNVPRPAARTLTVTFTAEETGPRFSRISWS